MSEPVASVETPPAVEAAGPRLLRLADLLSEADADARARYEAKQNGTALGPV